jgi:AraC-like DNA-binding protein
MTVAIEQAIGIPAIDFDSREAQPADVFDIYRAGSAPVAEVLPLGETNGFTCITRDQLVDSVLVSRLRTGRHLIRRHPEHLADGATDWIFVQLFVNGGWRGIVDDEHRLVFDTSTIGVLDLARPFAAATDPSDVIIVCVPRHRVERADDLHRSAPILALERGDPRGRVLADAVRRIWQNAATAAATDAARLSDTVIDALNRVLHPGDLTRRGHEIRAQAETFIQDHLADPDLDADSVAAAVYCSRSSLYRLFAQDGGVHRHIRSLRLRRCLSQLSRPSDGRRRVGDVASEWGFDDPSHFHRLFKAEFGATPSEVNDSATGARHYRPLVGASASLTLGRLHAWEQSAQT